MVMTVDVLAVLRSSHIVRGVRVALTAMEDAGEVSVTDDQVQDLT